MLAGCSGGEEATQASASVGGDAYTSEVLDTSYDDALNASNQLLLGTMQLEGTEQAVTPEQAATLLPLWRAMQGGVTAQTEVNALLKQIEGTMTQEQLQAIAAMQLTQEDLQAWMEEQGLGMGGGFPGAGDMSEEERENLRATAEAGGGRPGGGQFGDLSEEERANIRATMEAGGMPGWAIWQLERGGASRYACDHGSRWRWYAWQVGRRCWWQAIRAVVESADRAVDPAGGGVN